MNPTIEQLRRVIALVEAGSFTEAAERTRVSQPGLSRTIRDVERMLGLRLFDRTTRTLALTPDGAEFLGTAREIVAAYDGGVARFASYRQGLRGAVTIAALPSLAAAMVPQAVAEFRSARPSVQVTVVDGDARHVLRLVRTGEADLGLSESPDSAGDLQATSLGPDPMVAVVPRAHPLASAESVTWAQLASERFVLLGAGSSLRRLTDDAFAVVGVSPIDTVEVRSPGAAAGMVGAGLGVTAVTRSVLPLMAFAECATVPFAGPAVERSLAIITRRHPSLPPAADAFARLIVERSRG